MHKTYSDTEIDNFIKAGTINACLKHHPEWCPRKVEQAVREGRLQAFPMVQDWPDGDGWVFQMEGNDYESLMPDKGFKRFFKKLLRSK